MPPYRRLRVRHAREIGALLVEDGDRPFIVRFLLFDDALKDFERRIE
jgi:hypothetical protein